MFLDPRLCAVEAPDASAIDARSLKPQADFATSRVVVAQAQKFRVQVESKFIFIGLKPGVELAPHRPTAWKPSFG